MGDDVGEVVRTAGLQVRVACLLSHFGSHGDVVASELEVSRGGLDPSRYQEDAGSVLDQGLVADRVKCGQDPLGTSAIAEDDPGPAEPVHDAQRQHRVVEGGPGQCGIDVGALAPGEGQVLGLAGTAHPLGGGGGCLGEPRGMGRSGAIV
jgi:hypothetical protein